MTDFQLFAFVAMGCIAFYILWCAIEDWPRQ